MEDSRKKLMDVNETLKELGRHNSAAMKGFRKFMDATKKEGALSSKMKTIIGVAVAVSRQCEFCVPFYVKQALDAGASKEEIIDACMVSALLGGGPAVTFIKHVFDALEELAE